MTRYTRVRLVPRGPFHFGGRGVGMEHSDVGLPADGLFSALCMMLAEVGALDKLLNRFPGPPNASGQPPFRLTSLLPYAAHVYLLPYPLIGRLPVPGATDLSKRKLFKNIKWVSETVFRLLVSHEVPASALNANHEPLTDQSEKIWLTAQEQADLSAFAPRSAATPRPLLWSSDNRPRVTVDRQSSASAIYAIGYVQFSRAEEQTAGLYTVIEWLAADEATRALILNAFQRLGEAGIGGERSSGYGQFAPQFEELAEWSVGAPQGSYFVTLSPYHPQATESAVLGTGARYEISLRRGWLSLPGHQNLRRASVRMIAEGSVLRWPPQGEPMGDLAEVTPDPLKGESRPTIYRYGLAFPVRVADAAMGGTEVQDGGA